MTMYRHIRHLSIDVAAGAAGMMGLTARFFDVQVDTRYYILLSLVTWLIYTTDHLMDARNIRHEASTPRHRFHQKYFTPILVAALLGGLAFILLIPRHIPGLLFNAAFVLAFLVLVYFLSLLWARKTQFRYVLKELFIAICYTAGIALVPVYLSSPVDAMEWLFLLRIFVLALSNLFLFSVMEAGIDRKDMHPSAIRFMGPDRLRVLVQVLLWTNLSAGLVLIPFYWGESQLIHSLLLSVMNLVFMCIYYFPRYFLRDERYRIWGDGVFLIPFILYLF